MVFARRPLSRAVTTGLAVAALLSPVLATVGVFTRTAWWLSLLLVVALVVLVAVLVLSRQRGQGEGVTSVWDAIPGWQYDGRHVESGGLARGEQEQALRETQERAESEGGQQ